MVKKLLMCGVDLPLLTTREAVLRHNNFETSAAYGLDSLTAGIAGGAIDLVILCHTLSEQDQVLAMSLIREHQPSAKILVLTTSGTKEFAGCASLNTDEGPRALIEKARQLTTDNDQMGGPHDGTVFRFGEVVQQR